MALVFSNEDGTYATKCSICGKPLTDPCFATSHFIGDREYHLWRFSDSAMHWDCYANWEFQAEFADLYFQTLCDCVENEYWSILKAERDFLVVYGHAVKEVEVVLRKTGSIFRVEQKKWDAWLQKGWPKSCEHECEMKAFKEVLPFLQQVELSQ